MFLTKYRGIVPLLVGLGICAAGMELHRHWHSPEARAGGGAPFAGGANPVPQPLDLEARIYKALREKHAWKSPDGRYKIWVRQIEGRRLSEMIYKQADEQGRTELTAFADEGEVRVDQKAKGVLLYMRNGEVLAEKGGACGFFKEKTFDLTLPASMFGPAREGQKENEQHAEADRVLEMAFGAKGKEAQQAAVKLTFWAEGLVLAADKLTVEEDGRIRCAPCWLVRSGPDRTDGTRSMSAVRSREAFLTLDRRVSSVAELSGRRVTNVEPTGEVRITFVP
jgi:hypothetical protein